MESSIVNVEKTEFSAVKSPQIICLSVATKHGKIQMVGRQQKDRMVKVSCQFATLLMITGVDSRGLVCPRV